MKINKLNKLNQLTRRELLQWGMASVVASRVSGPTQALSATHKVTRGTGGHLLDDYDGIGLAELIRAKRISPQELLDLTIQRIEERNPYLNAVVTLMYEQARARIRDGLPSDGIFLGVPFLLKDLGGTYKGVVATAGSALLKNYIPQYDNELVKRYNSSGLVTVGKTNTPELGLSFSTEGSLFQACHNPWDLTLSPAGSSGGAAAAVAARMVPFAHGNDAAGSIRVPSSACGVFGLKPSRGRFPTGPEFGILWEGIAAGNVISISVRDSAAALDAICAPERGAPYFTPPPKLPFLKEVGRHPGQLRIAVLRSGITGFADPEILSALDGTVALCRSLGHRLTETSLDLDYNKMFQALMLVIAAQAGAFVRRQVNMHGSRTVAMKTEPWTLYLAELARNASAIDLTDTKSAMNDVTRKLAGFFEKFDVILSPTMPMLPQKTGYLDPMTISGEEYMAKMAKYSSFTGMYNMAGMPAMSVPLHWTSQDIPVGMQFGAYFGNEAVLFRLARQLEKARPWKNKRPSIFSI